MCSLKGVSRKLSFARRYRCSPVTSTVLFPYTLVSVSDDKEDDDDDDDDDKDDDGDEDDEVMMMIIPGT